MVLHGGGPVAIGLLGAAVILAALGTITYVRYSGRQAITLSLILISSAGMALGRFLTFLPVPETLSTVAAELPAILFVVAWFSFALVYAGYDRYLGWPTVGLVVVGTAVFSLVSIIDSLGHVPGTFAFVGVIGFMIMVGAMFAAATFVVAGVLRYDYVDTTSGVLLILGAFSVLLGPFVAVNASASTAEGELVGLLILVCSSGVILYYGDVFDVTPAAATIGRSATFDDVRDAVVVIDAEDRIADMNRAAEWTFATSMAESGGQALSELVGDLAEEVTELGKTEFVHDTPSGRRHLEATVSHVTDDDGHSVGKTLVMRDVTDRVTRSQQIEVLNRVLRHNLRNRATEIMLTAELVAGGEQPPERALKIVDSMEDLLSVGRKARELEDALGEDDGVSTADVGSILEHVTRQLGQEFPNASVSVTSTVEDEVAANPQIVELVVRHLGTNGIEHNDRDAPHVSFSAEREGDVVTIRVADDGPGIPDAEQHVIESGAETPLEHSTGIGLWCINWLVVHSGGDLTFEDHDEWSTVATVTLPLASARRRRPPGHVVAPADEGSDDGTAAAAVPETRSREAPSPFGRLVHFLRSRPDRRT